jgi:hypothetical protein
MKWVTPARLVTPPSHAGLGLLFLTESAAVKIYYDINNNMIVPFKK